MKMLNHKFLASLIIIKIVLGFSFIYMVGFNPILSSGDAIASEEQKDLPDETKKEINDDPEEKIELKFIQKKKIELDEKEYALEKKAEALLVIQEDINKKLALIKQLRNEITNKVIEQETIENEKLKHIVKAYSAMKPRKAASLVEKLDIGFAVEILSKMKAEEVGNILSNVTIEKAAKISKNLAEMK